MLYLSTFKVHIFSVCMHFCHHECSCLNIPGSFQTSLFSLQLSQFFHYSIDSPQKHFRTTNFFLSCTYCNMCIASVSNLIKCWQNLIFEWYFSIAFNECNSLQFTDIHCLKRPRWAQYFFLLISRVTYVYTMVKLSFLSIRLGDISIVSNLYDPISIKDIKLQILIYICSASLACNNIKTAISFNRFSNNILLS